MSRIYSNPAKQNDRFSLPDVEIYSLPGYRVYCEDCDETYIAYGSDVEQMACPECAHVPPHMAHDFVTPTGENGWFWQTCLPGCLPDSDPMGPFSTEEQAIAEAQEGSDNSGGDDDYVQVYALSIVTPGGYRATLSTHPTKESLIDRIATDVDMRHSLRINTEWMPRSTFVAFWPNVTL